MTTTSSTKITQEFFYSGLPLADYMQGMTKYQEMFEDNYHNFQLTAGELDALHSVKGPIHILVLTEDWCGDAARYVPALAHMAEAAGTWDLRIFYRDAHPDLANRWLKHGTSKAIPVMVFFDADWHEFACFVEKPELVYQAELDARAAFADAHPDLPDAGLPAGEMTQPTLELFSPYMKGFRLTNTGKWQHLFATDLLSHLQNALSGTTAGCW
jgi:hypothetical protein